MKNNFVPFIRFVLASILTVLSAVSTAVSASAAGSVIYVDDSTAGADNGTSWTDAYTDLQSALSTAISGDQIWVAAGTYTPTSGTDRTISFALKTGVEVYGGFDGTETLLSERDPETNLTILSGDLNGNDVGFTNNSENNYHVVTGSGTDDTAVLDGFTITGGNANGGSNSGGGMYNNAGSPTLTNVTISGNSALNGGGMYNYNNSPTLTNVTVSGNSALNGAGMYNVSSNPTLTNVTISGNSASNSGGGMVNSQNSSATLANVTISGNSASNSGGGMYNSDSSNPTLTNVTISGNSATQYGGGIINFAGSSPILTNVTLSGNSAGSDAGGILNNNSSPTLANVILWGNGSEMTNSNGSAPTIKDSIVQGGCPSGSNCINVLNANPLLGSLQDNGGLTETMALGTDSPAIDAGNDTNCPATDQRGVARPQGAHCDIGAYESSIPTIPAAATLLSPDGDIGTDFNPTYSWNEVAGATWYYLWINGPSGKVHDKWYEASVVCSSGTCSVIPAKSLNSGNHIWWVRTWNSVGYGSWSTGMTFSTSVPPPPAIATLVSPTGVIGDKTPIYTWDKVPGATWYYLWINGPSGNVFKQWYDAAVVCDVITCSITPPKALSTGNYTFWVQTWNPGGTGLWSLGMHFSISPPGATILLAPNNNINTNNPTYTWHEIPNTTWYYLWVNGPSGNVIKQWYQDSLICSAGTCSVTPVTSLSSGSHIWWVRTWNEVGYGPWSSSLTFNTP